MQTDNDWRALYPFESREIQLDGHRYHYVDEGAGPTLLLVHGNPTWSFYWRALIAGLRDSHRVIAVDHIGCGLSDKPRHYQYRLAKHVDNLTRFAAELDLRDVTLLAHDWGGAIGIGAALNSPQRYSRYIMFNTGAFRSDRMPWQIGICRVPGLGKLAIQGFNAFARGALTMATTQPGGLAPSARAGLLAPYANWHDRQAIYRFVDDIPMSANHPSYSTLLEIEQGLPTLAAKPWMFIWGMQDWCFTPEFLDRFVGFFPDAEVHRLAEAGHYVVEDAADQIVPLVARFVTRLWKVRTNN